MNEVVHPFQHWVIIIIMIRLCVFHRDWPLLWTCGGSAPCAYINNNARCLTLIMVMLGLDCVVGALLSSCWWYRCGDRRPDIGIPPNQRPAIITRLVWMAIKVCFVGDDGMVPRRVLRTVIGFELQKEWRLTTRIRRRRYRLREAVRNCPGEAKTNREGCRLGANLNRSEAELISNSYALGRNNWSWIIIIIDNGKQFKKTAVSWW